MGLGGMSFAQLLIIFLIIAVLFGTKKLRSIGEDLGSAVKGFKKGLQEGSTTQQIEINSDLGHTDKSPLDNK